MARPGISLTISPEGLTLIRNYRKLENTADPLRKSLDEISSTIMGKTQQAWARKQQVGEGGLPWPANFGAYAKMKESFLGQAAGGVTGVVNGLLQRSIAFANDYTALTSTVGTPQPHGPAFAQGGPGPAYIYLVKGDQIRRVEGGGTIPPRPFLPTAREAERIAEYTVMKNFRAFVWSAGIDMVSGGA